MKVGIFWVWAIECMCTQTRPQFILSSEIVFWEWSQIHVNSKGKSPLPGKKKISSEEDKIHDTTSSRTVNPTHYQQAILDPYKDLLKLTWTQFRSLKPTASHSNDEPWDILR